MDRETVLKAFKEWWGDSGHNFKMTAIEAWFNAVEWMDSRTCEGCKHSQEAKGFPFRFLSCDEMFGYGIVSKNFCCKYWEPNNE